MVGQEGRAEQVRIIRFEDHCIKLDEKALEQILLNDRIKDKHVAVISLAGDFRKGKSFMLSFFLRFLCNLGNPVWLGGPDEPLRGFAWRAGCKRHTTGILIWEEVFLVKTPQGEELAVLLMDTQGMHDDQSTVKESATIFALAAMLSSVFVFNISQNIQENDLQYFQLFTDYGRLAEERLSGKPFQKLLFLIRDWYHIKDAEFGATGGGTLLGQRLNLHESRPNQLQQPRKHIYDCFTDVDCFLMPHPGLKAAQGISFDGRLSDISDDFKKQLLHLVPSILSPEKLVTKEINGQKVTCQQLFIYIKAYVVVFKGGDLPEPKTMFEATAEANHQAALFKALEQYTTCMAELCGGRKLRKKQLKRIHEQQHTRAIETFLKTRKIGGEYLSDIYQETLSEKINKWFTCFACGMTKKPQISGTTCFKVAKGASVVVLGAGAVACFMIGVPLSGICFAGTGLFIAISLIMSLNGDCIVSDSTVDPHRTGKKASKEAPTNGQNFRTNRLHTDFLQQCINETSEAREMRSMSEIIRRAKEHYAIKMKEKCGEAEPFVKPDVLYDLHFCYRQMALKRFTDACTMAGMKPSQQYVDRLLQEIDEEFRNLSTQNTSKMGFGSRILARMRAMFKKSSSQYCRFKKD